MAFDWVMRWFEPVFLVADQTMRCIDSFHGESTSVISWTYQNKTNRHNNAIVFEEGSWVKKNLASLFDSKLN